LDKKVAAAMSSPQSSLSGRYVRIATVVAVYWDE
jgi:hypothetical protein